MTIQFQCKGCRRECTGWETYKGYCSACNENGLRLPQIKKVEKYEARDGTLHDSLDLAKEHQLMQEIKIALGVHEEREQQARHLLSHFDIVRKGDELPTVIYGPSTVKKVLHFWSFFIGATLATSVMLYLFR